jgi:hypothetical protein
VCALSVWSRHTASIETQSATTNTNPKNGNVTGENPLTVYPPRLILILTPLQSFGQASISFRGVKSAKEALKQRQRNNSWLDAKVSRARWPEAQTEGETEYVAEMAEERDHGAGLLVIRQRTGQCQSRTGHPSGP